jgi:PadR family transcriptional regulator, regulatory protein PadR
MGYVDTHTMAPSNPSLSFTGLFILQALAQGHRFGFDIMEVTGLPSGTVYPALRRLEAFDLVTSDWEKNLTARKQGRPRRRYYELTRAGRQQLGEAEARFRAVGRLFPERSTS